MTLSEFDLSRSFKVRSNGAIRLPIYGFLLMFNGNIWPSLAPLCDIRLQNMSDLDLDLSRSHKFKSNGVVRPPICNLVLVSKSNHISISCHLSVIPTRIFFLLSLIIRPSFRKSLGQIFWNAPCITDLQGNERSTIRLYACMSSWLALTLTGSKDNKMLHIIVASYSARRKAVD